MAFTPTVFANGVAPAINATELNKLGVGVKDAHDLAAAASDPAIATLIADSGSDVYDALGDWLTSIITGATGATYTALVTLIDARVSLLIVQHNGTTWPSYSTDSAKVRIFLSQPYSGAAAPTHYNTRDLWFGYPVSV